MRRTAINVIASREFFPASGRRVKGPAACASRWADQYHEAPRRQRFRSGFPPFPHAPRPSRRRHIYGARPAHRNPIGLSNRPSSTRPKHAYPEVPALIDCGLIAEPTISSRAGQPDDTIALAYPRNARGRASRPHRFGLRLQHHPDARGAGQGEMGRRAEQLSAPRRPHSQSGRHRAGLRQAGEGRADRRRSRRAPRRRRSRSTPRSSPIPTSSSSSRTRRTSCPARSAACSRSARTIPTSSRTRTSWRCSRSSKAPRTASRSRGATISRRCGSIIPSSRPSPASSGRRPSSAPTSRWPSSPPTRLRRRRRK